MTRLSRLSSSPASITGSNSPVSENLSQNSSAQQTYTFQHQALIDSFTANSAARLARIKRQSQDGWLMHILTAGWYGLFDKNIRTVSSQFRQTRAGSKSHDPQIAQQFDKELKNLRGTVAIILKKYGYTTKGEPNATASSASHSSPQA